MTQNLKKITEQIDELQRLRIQLAIQAVADGTPKKEIYTACGWSRQGFDYILKREGAL